MNDELLDIFQIEKHANIVEKFIMLGIMELFIDAEDLVKGKGL